MVPIPPLPDDLDLMEILHVQSSNRVQLHQAPCLKNRFQAALGPDFCLSLSFGCCCRRRRVPRCSVAPFPRIQQNVARPFSVLVARASNNVGTKLCVIVLNVFPFSKVPKTLSPKKL